jgi:HAMP domain-containing protein
MLFSERGRKLIHSAAKRIGTTRFDAMPGRLAAWNDPAKDELNHIQKAVKELEQSLATHTR